MRPTALATVFSALLLAFAGPADDVDDLIAKIKAERDNAEPELIAELAEERSRRSLEGLLDIYDHMASVYMKREVVRALPGYDGVPEAEQPALQKLMDVATNAEDRELRDAALEGLGGCKHLGKHFLKMIVDSPAQDDIRERAMDLHLELAGDEDQAWYRELYEPGPREEDDRTRRRRRDDDEEPEKKQHRLHSIREKAFRAIVDGLEDDEVERAATEDRSHGIRRAALEELHQRDHHEVESIARDVFEFVDGNPEMRAKAAEILAERNGDREANDFIDYGTKLITPDFLRFELARLVAGLDDDRVNSKVARLIGRGKSYEKRFALAAARGSDVRNLDKKIRRGLEDDEPSVQILTAQVIAERGDAEAVEDLLEMIEDSENEEVIAAGLAAVSELVGDEASWKEQVLAYVAREEREIRNAALAHLVEMGGMEHYDLFLQHLSHPDWSTRLAALHALEDLRTEKAVGPIIDQMASESGRMLYDFADVLWELTGQPFRTRVQAWKGWWEQEGDGFEIIGAAELAEREAEEEARRLKQISNVKFFGIRIISHRVIFIIDVSGSMLESTRVKYEGQTPETRIEVAKRELKKAIEGLDEDALFNVITFSGGVNSWLDGGVVGSSEKSREEALEWVDRLGAMGATNLYDSVRTAFEDPDVDTLFILSDGEPTAGEVTDPWRIREDVRRWNEYRDIVIHTVAVGGSLQILEWLAEDSGGSHVKFQ